MQGPNNRSIPTINRRVFTIEHPEVIDPACALAGAVHGSYPSNHEPALHELP
jgi:hypothetical protein